MLHLSFKSIFLLGLALIAGIVLRIQFLQIEGNRWDYTHFESYSSAVHSPVAMRELKNDYNRHVLPLLLLTAAAWFHVIDAVDPASSIVARETFFKLLPTAVEVFLLVYSVVIIQRKGYKYRHLLSIIVLLQPGLAISTAAWGQVDSILALLLLCAFMEAGTKPLRGFSLLVIACLFKPQAFIGMAIYPFLFLSSRRYFDTLKVMSAIVVLLTAGIISARLLGFRNLENPFLLSITRYPVLSVNAYNLWWFLFGIDAREIADFTDFFISPKFLSLSTVILLSIPGLLYLRTRKLQGSSACLVAGYAYTLLFFFATEMHERYLYYPVVLLSIGAMESKKLLWIYITLSTTLFLNVYLVVIGREQLFFPALLSYETQLRAVALLTGIATLGLICIFARDLERRSRLISAERLKTLGARLI